VAKPKSKKESDVNPIANIPPSQNPEVVHLWEILTNPAKYAELIKEAQHRWQLADDLMAAVAEREKSVAAREKKLEAKIKQLSGE